MKKCIKSLDIAQFLKCKLNGENILIKGYNSITELESNNVTFAKKMSSNMLEILRNTQHILAIVTPEYENQITCSYIISQNPRLDYLRIIKHFFLNEEKKAVIAPTAIIEKGAKIGKGVSIGNYCYIGSQVRIGDNTEIHHNVVILGKVNIGCQCYIKSGAIIGQEGFGFEINEEGVPEHFPHTGRIEIGNDVFIGANTTIERGTIGATKIEDHVKIDDKVQIGHNTITGINSLITAGVVLCGGVVLEKNSYVGPNAVIREKILVKENGFVGMGAVVVRNVEAGTVVAGNPARVLEK